MSTLRTSVVVCAYTEDRWTQICAAVDSALRQDPPPDEVLLVVDHNDRLLDRSRESFAATVRVIPSTGSPGLSGARNTGVAAARGDVIIFLDDDAVARPDWLSLLLRGYDDPLVMGTGGRAVPVWPEGGGRPRWLPEEFDWVVGCSYAGEAAEVSDVRNFLGANMSFRREAFEVAGQFDASVGRVGTRPVGCEETEFCIRLRQLAPHARLQREPAAVVDHHVAAARTRWRYFRARCYAEGMSKAVVGRLVGDHDGLSSERAYVRSVLPRAVARSLAEAVRTRELQALLRAANVVAGLGFTTAGYVRTRVSTRLSSTRRASAG
jgi:glycosyltransferase involved in cell wall biosynthesis